MAAHVEWNSSYELGIPAIDKQHQEFFRLANALFAAHDKPDGEQEARKTLEELIDYACYHFHTEEELLAEHGYPHSELEAHRREHQGFTARVRELRQQVYDGETILTELLDFTIRWLIAHISRRDVEYADYLKQQTGHRALHALRGSL